MSEHFNFHHLLRLRSAVFSVIEASQRYKHLKSQNVCHHQIRIVLECVVWTPCLISQVIVRTKSILNTFCEMMSSGHASIFLWRRTNETLIESTGNESLIIDCDFSVFSVLHTIRIGLVNRSKGKCEQREEFRRPDRSASEIKLAKDRSGAKFTMCFQLCLRFCIFASALCLLHDLFPSSSSSPSNPGRTLISTTYTNHFFILRLHISFLRLTLSLSLSYQHGSYSVKQKSISTG